MTTEDKIAFMQNDILMFLWMYIPKTPKLKREWYEEAINIINKFKENLINVKRLKDEK